MVLTPSPEDVTMFEWIKWWADVVQVLPPGLNVVGFVAPLFAIPLGLSLVLVLMDKR